MTGVVERWVRRITGPVDRALAELARRRPFTSRLHDRGVAARLGAALGVTFTICLVTGLVSHYMQHPPGWLTWPARPVHLYRVNQGLHVLSGLASVPLLLAKLWTVYPRLFQHPAVRSLGHALERALVLILVGAASFQVITGLFNVAATYPWSFSFVPVHFAMAFVLYGALVVHAGHQWATMRGALRTPMIDQRRAPGLTRRGFLGSVAAASGLLVLGSAGQTIPLPPAAARWLAPFATHLPTVGPQGLPVRTSAAGAGVVAAATDPAYRLVVTGDVKQELSLTLDELRSLPQSTSDLPITCVEGWSAGGTWRGIALRELLELVGAADGATVRVVSLQERGSYTSSVVGAAHVRDPLTLLALELNGGALHVDHGAPVRLIAPNRPGVMQTKWVTRVEVLG